MTVQIKRCNACRVVKLLAEFDRHPSNRDRRQGTCRSCAATASPIRRHGMTRVEVAAIAESQGGCAICGTTDPGRLGWVVDHDHRCCGPKKSCRQCQRGVICCRCNTALGMARDNPDTLRRMAEYLESHRSSLTDRSSESLHRTGTPDRLTESRRTYGLTEK